MNQSIKKRKLTIHIGTEKTGTTSIQSFLEINQIALKKQNISCPNSLRYADSFNHRLAAVISYSDKRNDDNTKFLFNSLDERKKHVENIISALKVEIFNNPYTIHIYRKNSGKIDIYKGNLANSDICFITKR